MRGAAFGEVSVYSNAFEGVHQYPGNQHIGFVKVMVLVKYTFGRDDSVGDFIVVEDGFATGDTPHIRIRRTVIGEKIKVNGPGYFLRNPERKGGGFPGVKPKETHFSFMAEIKEIFIPGHVYCCRKWFFFK